MDLDTKGNCSSWTRNGSVQRFHN